MKKIYALALATMLAISMSAFAGTGTKSCNKPEAKTCELKDKECDKSKCDDAKCDKSSCDKKSCTKAEKKAS
jgi:hypothetical protein